MIKHKKPSSFYDEFVRKGPGQKTTHYCPGCGHGTVHKLLAEAVDRFKIQDRMILCSPVGCAVFAYYYFDCGNTQCSHGRAPAVATGLRRTAKEAVIVSYQGDGDLAGIGTTEIIHAANRGENITVLFVNNAIYGMTGGQMAPTTLIGQKTQTTPLGRSAANEGYPIRMAELIDALEAPVFIERVSLGDARRVLHARQAIQKALQLQIEKKGFSFVEILSPCPVNWKMSPTDARKWLIENLEPVFEIKRFRDNSSSIIPSAATTASDLSDDEIARQLGLKSGPENVPRLRTQPIADQYIKIAGFGGQGIMSAGMLMAECAMTEGLNVTWLPSYGPEMRGGTANASIIISSKPIGAPLVDRPNVLIAMNAPSLDTFEEQVQPAGLILVNSSLIPRQVRRNDVRVLYVPATGLALEQGLAAGAPGVMTSIYAATGASFDIETLRAVLPSFLKKKHLVDANQKALETGFAFYRRLTAAEKDADV